MNTAVINIKIAPDIKAEAQALSKELGFSLSGLINGLLKQVIRTRTVTFQATEEPNDYLLKALVKSREDIKKGRVISFKDNKKMFAYLDGMINDDKKHSQN